MHSFYTYASPIDEFDEDVLLLQLVVGNCRVDIGKWEPGKQTQNFLSQKYIANVNNTTGSEDMI